MLRVLAIGGAGNKLQITLNMGNGSSVLPVAAQYQAIEILELGDAVPGV
jgi:hypothetical protein